MRDILDNPSVERVKAVMITLGAAALLWVLSPLLVHIALYIMGAVAVNYLWTEHIRPTILVRRLRRDLN